MHIEEQLTYLREDGVKLLETAKHDCETLIIISDFYHSSAWLKKLLQVKGIHGFDHLYSSSDKLITKRSGSLYDYIIKDLNVSPKDWVHIGDNERADIEKAKEGINTVFRQTAEPFYRMRGLALN